MGASKPGKLVRISIIIILGVLVTYFGSTMDQTLSPEKTDDCGNGLHCLPGYLKFNESCLLDQTRYLFMSYQPEQLGKARSHFSEVAYIAKALNRTLVLTQCGNSTISVRQNLSLSTYYNITTLSQYTRTLEYADFLHLISSHQFSAQAAWILPEMEDGYQCGDTASSPTLAWHSGQAHWDEEEYLDFSNHSTTLCLYCKSQPRVDMQTLLNVDADVLIIKRYSSKALLAPKTTKQVTKYLEHPRAYFDVVQAFRASYGSYISVNWRMETSPKDALECSRLLADAIQSSDTPQLDAIYFSTDFPDAEFMGAFGGYRRIKSNSWWSNFDENSHQSAAKAFGYINDTFAPKLWSSLDFSPLGNAAIDFPGTLGILEKLVAVEADFLIIGQGKCSKKGSYTLEILDRRRARKSHGGHQLNLARWW
ncbi:MAG: hypothetical protein SGCHY_000350 [Lobulomycetales sp.]